MSIKIIYIVLCILAIILFAIPFFISVYVYVLIKKENNNCVSEEDKKPINEELIVNRYRFSKNLSEQITPLKRNDQPVYAKLKTRRIGFAKNKFNYKAKSTSTSLKSSPLHAYKTIKNKKGKRK